MCEMVWDDNYLRKVNNSDFDSYYPQPGGTWSKN